MPDGSHDPGPVDAQRQPRRLGEWRGGYGRCRAASRDVLREVVGWPRRPASCCYVTAIEERKTNVSWISAVTPGTATSSS